MSRFAVVEAGNGRLIVVAKPARCAVVAKWLQDYETALRWARDEQKIRDALATVNGRRWYTVELVAGSLALFVLVVFCVTVGVLGLSLSSIGS